jgi:DNA-binding NarL/FixJ family response regulator
MLRLLLADNHEIVRRGVRGLVREHPSWEIVGEATCGRQALELALRDAPDIAVLEVALPQLDGIELTRTLKENRSGVRVLLFTTCDDDETVKRCLDAGVRGYVMKSDSERSLEAAISALGANKTYFSASVSEMLLSAGGSGRFHEKLSPREREVVRLVARGMTNAAIAQQLGLGVKTVETHRAKAMRKADVRGAADLVRFGVKQGLIEP